MAYQMKDGTGTLFKVQDKKNERGPDYTGDCMIGGEVFRMAAWIRESESGRKYMSFKFEPKEEVKPQKPTRRVEQDDESDVPF